LGRWRLLLALATDAAAPGRPGADVAGILPMLSIRCCVSAAGRHRWRRDGLEPRCDAAALAAGAAVPRQMSP